MSKCKAKFVANEAGSGKTPASAVVEIAQGVLRQQGVLVDVEQWHRLDVLTLKRHVDAANMRITAACTDLRATQYAESFEPQVTLSQYEALEREIANAKALIFKPL